MSLGYGAFLGGLTSGAASGLDMYQKMQTIQQSQLDIAKQNEITKRQEEFNTPGSTVPIGGVDSATGTQQALPNTPPQALQPNDASNTISPDSVGKIPGVADSISSSDAPAGIALPSAVPTAKPDAAAAPPTGRAAIDPKLLSLAGSGAPGSGAPITIPGVQPMLPVATPAIAPVAPLTAPQQTAIPQGATTPLVVQAQAARNLGTVPVSQPPATQGPPAPPPGPSPVYAANLGQRESSGNANAVNPNANSSATGLQQFTERTWMDIFPKLHPELVAGKTPDEVLAYRNDPAYSSETSVALAQQNTPLLQAAGIPVNDTNLALAHQWGGTGVKELFSASPTDLMQDVVGVKLAAENDVTGQTVGQVLARAQTQMTRVPSGASAMPTANAAASGAPAAPGAAPAAAALPRPDWPTARDPSTYLGTTPDVAPVTDNAALQAVNQQAASVQAASQPVLKPWEQNLPPPPPGQRYVTEEEYDHQKERLYLDSGRPNLIKIGESMRENRLLAAHQEQLVQEGKMELAAKVTGQMVDHALQTMATNPQGGLDELTAVLNHGVPNGSRMVVDPADGPVSSDGKYVITHLMNGKIIGKDSPQTPIELAAKIKGMSNPEGYANFLAKSSEVAKNQAEAQHWATQNKILDEELRLGKPKADVDAIRAKIDTEVASQQSLAAFRKAQEEGMRLAQEKATRIAGYAQIYADPNSSAADKAKAYNLRAMEEGTPPLPEPHTDNQGNVTITNLGSVDPYLSKSDLLGGGFYPTNTAFKEIAADPDWKAQRIVSVVDPIRGIGWTSPQLPAGPNGQRPFSKNYRDLQLALHPELRPKSQAVPQVRGQSASGAPMTAAVPAIAAREAPGAAAMGDLIRQGISAIPAKPNISGSSARGLD